jgi:hypothetical protein
MRDVRLVIGSNAASVWWLNDEEVIGIYGDRQTVIDDGVSKRITQISLRETCLLLRDKTVVVCQSELAHYQEPQTIFDFESSISMVAPSSRSD